MPLTLIFQNVTKEFRVGKRKKRNLIAVDNFNLKVEQGEMVVLLGPSGCGKTTLLRMVAGLDDVSDGKIMLDRQNIASISPSQRPFAMVFQNYALYPHMTAKENLTYALRVRRVKKGDIERRLDEIVELVRLEPGELNRKPPQLSGGQQQRVALGRALMLRPGVLLLDEPFSNLDQHLRMHVRIQLRKIQKSLGLTVIMVTHDHDEASAMGDRIVLMNQGRVEQHGTPESLFERPKSLFSAKFMGFPTMNLIEGRVVPDGSGRRFQEIGEGSIEFRLENSMLSRLSMEKKLILGIRPQFVSIKPFSDKIDRMTLHGTGAVLDEERCGMDRYIHMDTGSHVVSGSFPRCSTRSSIHLREIWAFQFNTNRILFFHPETEECLFP